MLHEGISLTEILHKSQKKQLEISQKENCETMIDNISLGLYLLNDSLSSTLLQKSCKNSPKEHKSVIEYMQRIVKQSFKCLNARAPEDAGRAKTTIF